ncbi:murein L,D-transpeptidase [Roseobacter denitrificans]|uniref:Peptidoglycan binding domain protein, putative n=1 Tax=Roseobacter denitrificans (strain ATCC 33942 / OCh 114) TaxID=375451 RepID=Q166C4_ROSDO|nr:L,D-transpeptidase family protein [Roseobacter denitrificans]ABG32169.1 peptidoglycan binding domain protein, putative [Roseobacter denitrificans OCh 114]AVL51670.1 murein L,D-transpeptidase [Roseobacter denitrificans]SFF78210.1 Murein L,D-transpeptidase YcbB/YkuD [Roseobacter denitrificans OCh 114]
MISAVSSRLPTAVHVITLLLWSILPSSGSAGTETVAFKQAVAEAAAQDQDIAAFYRETGYDAIWTGTSGRERNRRAALIDALAAADDHGLPSERYGLGALEQKMKTARTPRDLGLVEVAMSRAFLQYARDIQTGALVPSRVDKNIVRQVPYRDRKSYLTNFAKSSPKGFFKALPPQTGEYNALMKQKLVLEGLVAKGGWGPTVKAKKLEPGDQGASVVALRDRLIRMGYLKRSAASTYDAAMTAAVVRFQADHGLAQDGIVGRGTLAEINTSVRKRLQAVIVAMERERWVNKERGTRHIEVNLTDFTAKIIDKGKVTFSTRSVIGARDAKRQSPEFSDVMEFMVINPSWFVPRSIATGEYLPELQQDPNAVNHLIITDRSGRQIDRANVDFTKYTERTFPYAMRQPPSRSNALGLVKFMFPNKYNIYLHDTPAKNLFGRETRAYSHGCIRLADPFEFAYALLAKQSGDPEGLFQKTLATGKETQLNLKKPVPVHIIYRTAVADSKGRIQYRRDVYGRDGRIWEALSQAGVALRGVQG